MAHAKVKKRNTPREFTVKLTEGEVDFLIALTSMVSGDQQASPRKYGDRIRKTLINASGYDVHETDAFRKGWGGVHFMDYDVPSPITLDHKARLAQVVAMLRAGAPFAGDVAALQVADEHEALLREIEGEEALVASLIHTLSSMPVAFDFYEMSDAETQALSFDTVPYEEPLAEWEKSLLAEIPPQVPENDCQEGTEDK